jgi:hypothetical protein
MNHYKYKPIDTNQHVCNICYREFHQIYTPNNDVEMNQIQPKNDRTHLFNSLIQSLKDNIDELQTENNIIKRSLEFYRNLYYRNIHKLV